jgi:hypothetical protein
MVKLVRLTTTDNQAIFDTNFNTEILIEPKSQVALKSVTLERVRDVVTINESNKQIDFTVADRDTIEIENPQTAFLTDEVYDPNLMNDPEDRLLTDIKHKINQYSQYYNFMLGVEAKASQVQGKVEIEFNQGPYQENQSDWIQAPVGNIERVVSGNNVFYQPDVSGSLSLGQVDLYQTKYMSKGVAQFGFQLGQVGTSTDDCWYMGFSYTDPQNITTPLFDINNIYWGVKLPSQNGGASPYETINNGTLSATSTTPTWVSADNTDTNDFVKIKKYYDLAQQATLFEVAIRPANSAVTFVYQKTIAGADLNKDFYPVLVFLSGNANASVKDLRSTISPYNPNHNHITPTENINYMVDEPTDQKLVNQKSKHIRGFIQFQGDSLRKYLRYDTLRVPATGYNQGFPLNYKADKTYKPNNQADAFIVEFLNLPLTAWDGLVETRQPYLNVIPIEVGAGDKLIYDTPFPIFIDIDNAQPLGLRNLKVRILNNDLSPFEMTGLASMTLLIKDKSE